jgi:hypothetical protein
MAAAAFATAVPTPVEVQSMQASGTFTVKMSPQDVDNDDAKTGGIARLSINKQFSGPMDGTSRGEMLAIGDGSKSGAYVALERFEGQLDGHRGGFSLMHKSGLRAGTPENWTIDVVPDSGSNELNGITGQMRIVIEQGVHRYYLDYTLPQS